MIIIIIIIIIVIIIVLIIVKMIFAIYLSHWNLILSIEIKEFMLNCLAENIFL